MIKNWKKNIYYNITGIILYSIIPVICITMSNYYNADALLGSMQIIAQVMDEKSILTITLLIDYFEIEFKLKKNIL